MLPGFDSDTQVGKLFGEKSYQNAILLVTTSYKISGIVLKCTQYSSTVLANNCVMFYTFSYGHKYHQCCGGYISWQPCKSTTNICCKLSSTL